MKTVTLFVLAGLPLAASVINTTLCRLDGAVVFGTPSCELDPAVRATAEANLSPAGRLTVQLLSESAPGDDNGSFSQSRIHLQLFADAADVSGILMIDGLITTNVTNSNDVSARFVFLDQVVEHRGIAGRSDTSIHLVLPYVFESQVPVTGIAGASSPFFGGGINTLAMDVQFGFFLNDGTTPVALTVVDPDVVIPEPGTFWLVGGLGMIVLGRLRRRWK